MPLHENADLRALIEELLSQWDVTGKPQALHQPAARKGRKITGSDVARVTSVYGLARHVHELARAVCLLLRQGYANAAIPVVRTLYENALTAAWLVQSKGDHGIRAFVHEHARIRRALQNDAFLAASEVFREGASEIADTDPTPYLGSTDSVRNFHDVCLDLKPAGKDAFIYFRLFSNFSHASPKIADLYFESAAGKSDLPAYLHEPEDGVPVNVLLFFTAASLVWAARAYSYLLRDNQYRNFLRSCARKLGVEADLQLSEHYYQRHAKRAKNDAQPTAGPSTKSRRSARDAAG